MTTQETRWLVQMMWSVGALLTSLLLSLLLYIFFRFYFGDFLHDMHASSPGLTFGQVIKDVGFSCSVCGAISAFIIGLLGLMAIDAPVEHEALVQSWLGGNARSVIGVAAACWLVLNSVVSIAAFQYLMYMAEQFN